MKRRMVFGFVACVLSVLLTACGRSDEDFVAADSMQSAGERKLSQSGEFKSSAISREDTVSRPENSGVDLSAYEDHGKWSCGRCWVKKRESGDGEEVCYYGYIDTDGNLVGEWHDEGDWCCPRDYVLDYALVYRGWDRKGQYDGTDCYSLYTLDGREALSFEEYAFYRRCPDTESLAKQGMIQKLNENGILFYTAPIQNADEYLHPVYMCRIMEDGNISLNLVRESMSRYISSDSFESGFTNGYMVYYNVYYPGSGSIEVIDIFYMDEAGQTVLDLSDFGYHISEAGSIEDGRVKIIFYGEDFQKYSVYLDLEGNWISEPEAV